MTKVIIKQCDDYDIAQMTEAIDSGVALLGGWENFVKSHMKVLLKINLIGPKPPESAAVTHCEFVRAIIRILMRYECEVWIGDSAGGAIAGITPTAGAMNVSGMVRVAAEEGAFIKNFEGEGTVRVEPDNGRTEEYYLAKPLFDADLVINLPKFKTHSMGIFTGAVKNLYGCIPGLKKATYHRQAPDAASLGSVIANINTAIRPGLHIMDGIMAMHKNGPTAGEPYHAGKILISADPLALDTVAASMIGLDISDLPIFEASIKRNIGESTLGNIDVLGDFGSVPPRLKDYKLPKGYGAKGKGYKSFNKIFIKLIDFLKTRPEIDLSKCTDCGSCMESCPVNAIDRLTKTVDYNKCIECMCCHELCMYKAVELKRANRFARMIFR